MLPAPYDALHRTLAAFVPPERLVTDPLRLLAWGTDASFYRLVPKLVVVVDSEDEVQRLLALCAELRTPVTFRAAGTSLSGQAISDSVLAVLGEGWRRVDVADDGKTITLQPGVTGARANQALARFGRKIGPDPASIDTAMIGGIAANNSSGMCCGTAQNSYHTLAGVRMILADGTVLDTRDAASRAAFRGSHREWLEDLARIAASARADPGLASRIRHKFRMKNTTGYSLNALVDFEDPIDVAAHLMIGSEGTLGFISAVTYETVPEHAHKASALVLFADIASACRAVVRARAGAGGRSRARGSGRAALGAGQARHAGGLGHARPGRRGAAHRNARGKCRDPADAGRRGERAARAHARHRRAALRHRSGRMREAVERAQGHVPVGGRDAPDRYDRDHRGRRLPGRAPCRGHARPAAAAAARTAIRKRSSSATRSRATCTSCSRRTSTMPPRSRATRSSWTRSRTWSWTGTTARSRPSTARGATWRRSSSSNGARRRPRSCTGSRRCSIPRGCSIPASSSTPIRARISRT